MGRYFVHYCNMKVVCVLLLLAFYAVHAKRDAYLDIIADEFEKMGMTDEEKGGKNGEQVCEGHGFREEQCLNISCCEWNDGQCWSAVGQDSCDGEEWDKPEKPEPTDEPEEPEPTTEPEKPEPTAEPEKPEPTEEVDEAVEEAGDHFLSGILLPIEGKRSCHHRGCYLCYHKCLPCLECIGNDHPACALCHKCAPCTQCLHCFDLKNPQYLF